MGQKLDKFLLLMWKNWLLQWRHPIQTLVEILAPVCFSALLVLVRSLVDPEEYPEGKLYQPYEITMNITKKNSTIDTIAWSPWNPELEKIMSNTAAALNLSHHSLNDSASLQRYLQNEINLIVTLAGVQFPDSLFGANPIPKNMNVTLRFPGELRTGYISGFVQNTWLTNLLYPLYQIAGPRERDNNEGARPGYSREGFLALQQQVSFSIIDYFSPNFSKPQILMQRFPYPKWISDPLLTALQSFVGIIIMLSFVYTCISTVKIITTEKEKQLKEAMKIMGLPNWLHWTAWFLKTFSFLLITVSLMVTLIKVTWYPGTTYSVFTFSDPFVILLFLVLYMCATITFCFAISVFFSKANTAATIAGMAWFLSYTPYLFLQQRYSSLSYTTKMISSLGSNSAMAFGFQLMLMFEGTGEGLQWKNIFRTVTPDDNITLGHLMIMMVVDTFIYLFIALYVEAIMPGDYGVPQKWYFPFTSSFWCGLPRYTGVENFSDDLIEGSTIYEKEPTNLPVGVKIRNLRKVYARDKVAVRNLSLNMYEGQITVLLGHNGAGKTTTMSLLTGMFPPTSGTAIVGGHDICTDMDGVRGSLGLCPQHNILFDELTVREHLYFYCKLKGLKGDEIGVEIKKFIELLDLVPKKHAKAATLSGGMKRKLSAGVALCGKSKIVMFDEPTAGMDPAARRALWDLLQNQKQGRTILLSTHFMDEADLLGDRIAIMAGGHLQCCGSSFFLKKKYGAGYHLIMDKKSSANVSTVTELLKKHIPNIEVQNNVGSELSYLLNEEQSSVFEEMLSDLENNSERLGIQSYGISLTTMEEVFMKVGADHGQEELMNGEVPLGEQQTLQVTNGHHETNGNPHWQSSDVKLNVDEHHFLTGFPLLRNQILAMLLKKFLTTIRTWILFIIQIILPVMFLIIAIISYQAWDQNADLPDLFIGLDSYDKPVTVLNGSVKNIYYINYLATLNQAGWKYLDWKNEDLSDNMLAETDKAASTVRMRYIAGATFHQNQTITAWFNNEPYHSPPLALGMAINSVVRNELGIDYGIGIFNRPLPYTFDTKFKLLLQGSNMGFQIAFNIGFSMAFISSFYVLFCVRERVSKAKHLQFVSGVEVLTFWVTTYFCDLLTYIWTILALIGTMGAFQEDGFKTAGDLARVFSILICFGMAMLPMMYLASYFFDIPSTGYTRMTLINIFTGVAAFLIVQVLSAEQLNLKHIGDALHWVFLSIPHYCLSSGIFKLNFVYSQYKLCGALVDLCLSLNITELTPSKCWALVCYQESRCCDVKTNYYSWADPGVGRNVIFSFGITAILISVLLINEFRIIEFIKYQIQQYSIKLPAQDPNEDDDVLTEKQKIHTATTAQLNNYSLALRDVTKYYNKMLAVNGLCLGVNKHECFGLLGVNGAGKTSTFKMMTGDELISYGDGWVNGFSFKKDMKKVHKLVGYCPQFDALLDDLTGRESLTMFSLLRGIPYRDCNYVAESLAREFDFIRHLDKKIKEYSGGNKRKLSTAVALIGDPPVVYLDEPTTGMDPAAKRQLWNALCRIRDNGKCIILTSHSMEECEALCTKLAIMVNGSFKCLGSVQHLKNKFSEGYTLTIKIKKLENAGDVQTVDIEPIQKFVSDNFPNAVLREKHQELLTYYIANSTLLWSRMFGIMEGAKRALNIEDYSLGQCSLEQVFLTFTKLQREE